MKIKSLLVTIILAATVLGFTGFASAQGTDNLALIAQIKEQIAKLTAQLQTLIAEQGTTQTWCYTFNTYLVAGFTDTTTNKAVTNLQTALTKEGFNVSQDAQGTFGDNTAAGVVGFQGKYHIRQTGTVGPVTRAKLNEIYQCAATVLPPTIDPNIKTPLPVSTTCEYAQPPAGCSWVLGSSFNSSNQCGMVLQCNNPSSPADNTTPTCSAPIDCAQPPPRCSYINSTSCSCGQLSCAYPML